MAWSNKARMRFANFLIGVGMLLVLSFFGMAFGAPLITWGIDLKRQIRKEENKSSEKQDTPDKVAEEAS